MIIRQIKHEELIALIESWQIAYGELAPYFYPDRFDWLFNLNPFKINQSENSIIVAKEGNKIVSWVCNMWIEVFIKDRSIPAIATINAFTLPEFRNKGLISRIYSFNTSQNETLFFTTEMADETRRIKNKLKWIKGHPQYQLICRVGEFDKAFLFKSLEDYFMRHNHLRSTRVLMFLRKLGIGNLLKLFAYQVFKKKKSFLIHNKNLEFIKNEKFESSWDELWQEIKKNYTFGCERTAKYLNWKYSVQPHLHFSKYIIQEEGKLIGALVFRAYEKNETPHGIITEVLLLNNAAFYYDDVINFASKKLSDLGCQYIFLATANEREKILASINGFHLLRVNVPLLYIPEKIKGTIREDELISNKSSWLLSMGDQDMDQFQFNMHPGIISTLLVAMKRTPGINHLS